ncbi:MAG: hydrolase, partial [Coriobacteriaceae bacterium]|nr:hydrolase [Coriobacteriaceae bacterium]
MRRLVLGPLETNCWLADDEAGGPVAVIDPAGDSDELLGAISG